VAWIKFYIPGHNFCLEVRTGKDVRFFVIANFARSQPKNTNFNFRALPTFERENTSLDLKIEVVIMTIY